MLIFYPNWLYEVLIFYIFTALYIVLKYFAKTIRNITLWCICLIISGIKHFFSVIY